MRSYISTSNLQPKVTLFEETQSIQISGSHFTLSTDEDAPQLSTFSMTFTLPEAQALITDLLSALADYRDLRTKELTELDYDKHALDQPPAIV